MRFLKYHKSVFCTLIISLLFCISCNNEINTEPAVPISVANNACANMPTSLKAGCIKLQQEGKRNWVLNCMNLGLDALQQGYLNIAARSFDDALLNIETVYAHNQNAAKARSLWREEGSKDFKGEPYERVMAFYYRGLIDLMQNDIDNARASFRGGALQDAFAEDAQNRCDFALMVFLQGWCSQLMRDRSLMNESYNEVKKLRKDFPLPKPDDNVLFIIELGTSPRKRTDGIGHAELKFFRGRNFTETRVNVKVNETHFQAHPIENIFWQSSTRGARPIDAILDGQVRFKKGSFVTGSDLSDMSSVYGTYYAGTSVGTTANALGLIGGLVQLGAANMKAKADARYWKNLPDSVHIFTTKLSPGFYRGTFDFYDDYTNLLPGLNKTIEFEVVEAAANVVWVRSRSQISCTTNEEGGS